MNRLLRMGQAVRGVLVWRVAKLAWVALIAWMVTAVAVPSAPAFAQRRAQVSVHRLRVEGPVSRADVQRALETSLPEIRRCITARLAERDGLAGELRVRVYVAADGVALAAAVDWSSVDDRPLQRCVTAQAQNWTFSEAARPTEIHFRVRVGSAAARARAAAGQGRNIRQELQEGATPPGPPSEGERRTARAVLIVEDGSVVLRGISLQEVRTELRSRHGSLTRCIERHVRPFAQRGVVTIEWRLRANGRIVARPTVRMTGTLPGAARTCVARAARRFRFPAASTTEAGERRVSIALRVDWER